jgi:hypothetical protein
VAELHQATMIYDDGNANEYARNEIRSMDFPLEQIRLFACVSGERFVFMLPSEYSSSLQRINS